MPGGDGTGPDGKGPKNVNKGWPERYEHGQGRRKEDPKFQDPSQERRRGEDRRKNSRRERNQTDKDK